MPAVKTCNDITVISGCKSVKNIAVDFIFYAGKSKRIKKGLRHQSSDICSICNRYMSLGNKFTVSKNFSHKAVAVIYGSVYFNRNDISAVPDKIAFNHSSYTPFGINQNGFYILFSPQGECKTCSKFTCRNIKKNGRTSVKL